MTWRGLEPNLCADKKKVSLEFAAACGVDSKMCKIVTTPPTEELKNDETGSEKPLSGGEESEKENDEDITGDSVYISSSSSPFSPLSKFFALTVFLT